MRLKRTTPLKRTAGLSRWRRDGQNGLAVVLGSSS